MPYAVIGCLFLWVLGPVQAEESREREHLAQLVQELELLEPLVEAAERESDHPARYRFQYGWLRQDLNRVRQGIRDHLDPPAVTPKRQTPVEGDYRR